MNSSGHPNTRIWSALFSEGDNAKTLQRLHTLLGQVLREELTQRQREILLLYEGQGLTQKEIAEHFGITQSVVSRHVQRALRRVKRFTDKLE